MVGETAVAVFCAAASTDMEETSEPEGAVMAPETPDGLCREPVRVAFQADAAQARELRLPALFMAEVKPAEGVAKTV